MALAIFLATTFGLYSKESAMCAVPLLPLVALMSARAIHPHRPRAWLRALLAFIAAAAAFILYVEARRRLFPVHVPDALSVQANAHRGIFGRAFAALLRWFGQPMLPRDPLNNPLVEATPRYRIAGALRVYTRGLGQILFPKGLSGDYSAPQEPIPDRLIFPESVLGALAMIVPLVLAPVLGVLAWRRARRLDVERARLWGRPLDEFARRARADGDGFLMDADAIPAGVPGREALLFRRVAGAEPVDLRPIAGAAMAWVVISYFPVSNIPVLLPTVRAERFWYFPAIGTSLLLAMAFVGLVRAAGRARGKWPRYGVIGFLVAFMFVQGVCARAHANDYTDDLVFWDATRHAVPRSAKAHLNYSVMQGARGNLEERRRANVTALELAPTWPMANVYLGDTLCRLHRAPEALPHYEKGFELAPNDQNLVALGVQCLWDEKQLAEGMPAHDAMEDLAEKHPGSWVAYIVRDTIDNGATHNGVDPKYRPRGYNEGPKGE
jgi:hypothetical protein